MKQEINLKVSDSSIIRIELDDSFSPNTVEEFLRKLPFSVNLNLWGEEIYTSESPIDQNEENSISLVNLNDVAYWPTGKAICLFYGPTPIGNVGEITPASPVNKIGRILSPNKKILNIIDGRVGTFSLT